MTTGLIDELNRSTTEGQHQVDEERRRAAAIQNEMHRDSRLSQYIGLPCLVSREGIIVALYGSSETSLQNLRAIFDACSPEDIVRFTRDEVRFNGKNYRCENGEWKEVTRSKSGEEERRRRQIERGILKSTDSVVGEKLATSTINPNEKGEH